MSMSLKLFPFVVLLTQLPLLMHAQEKELGPPDLDPAVPALEESPYMSPSLPDDPSVSPSGPVIISNCKQTLLAGQYKCNTSDVDPDTQQPRGCNKDTNRAPLSCYAVPGITCSESGNRTFFRDVPCQWTNGYEFDTALILSVFLGMLGADRFYLGYPALGLLKFSTLGFFFLGQLLDIILLAGGVTQPADGSSFVVSYFGPAVTVIGVGEDTAMKPQSDWFT